MIFLTTGNNSFMPRKSRLNLPPLDLGEEAIGQRITRLRKEHGYSQIQLAEKIGIIQELVSNYENNKLRLNADMLVRFAKALDVSADVLLGLQQSKTNGAHLEKIPRRLLRRVEKIQNAPPRYQRTILETIDAILKGARA